MRIRMAIAVIAAVTGMTGCEQVRQMISPVTNQDTVSARTEKAVVISTKTVEGQWRYHSDSIHRSRTDRYYVTVTVKDELDNPENSLTMVLRLTAGVSPVTHKVVTSTGSINDYCVGERYQSSYWTYPRFQSPGAWTDRETIYEIWSIDSVNVTQAKQ